jgi:hypothetical protein
LYTELSRFAPHHGQFLRPLSLNSVGATIVRRHDVVLPSIFATIFTTPRPHELTLLSSVLSTLDTRMDERPLQPRSGYKMETLYPEPPTRKLHFHPSSTLSQFVFPFQLALATRPLKHLFHLLQSSRASCSPVFVPDVEVKLRVDRKKEFKTSCHP